MDRCNAAPAERPPLPPARQDSLVNLNTEEDNTVAFTDQDRIIVTDMAAVNRKTCPDCRPNPCLGPPEMSCKVEAVNTQYREQYFLF